MQIISRAEAAALGLNKYFTGKPCKNGHVNHRYLKSGSCQSCIAESNGRAAVTSPEVLATIASLAAHPQQDRSAETTGSELERHQMKTEQRRLLIVAAESERANRKAIVASLVQVRLRAFETDRDALALAVWSLTAMRYPTLTIGDVDPRLLPKDKTAGTALYAFNCHSADVDAAREIAAGMLAAKPFDTAEARRKAQAAAQQFDGAADSTPPMSFK